MMHRAIEYVLIGWCFILLVISLRELYRFTYLKALTTIILPFIGVTGLGLILLLWVLPALDALGLVNITHHLVI